MPNGTVEFVDNNEEYYFLPIFVAYGTQKFLNDDKKYNPSSQRDDQSVKKHMIKIRPVGTRERTDYFFTDI